MLMPDTIILAALAASLVLPLLFPFVMGPMMMRARSSQSASPEYTPDDEHGLPPAARRAAAILRGLGFEDRGTWLHEGSARATGQVILLECPRTRDVARVMVVTAFSRRSVSLAFQTRFADGTETWTVNQRILSGFPPVPDLTVAWLPELRDAASLYQVHAQLRNALGRGCERVGIGNDPAAFLRDVSLRSLANWVANGYYSLDATRGVVRPTWKGAILITWRLLWPIKPLFRAQRRRATRQLLDHLGIALG